MTAIIQTEKLTKYYGKHRGIIDVDLVVNEGEAFGFLGPNGAGKTTMIRTLLDHIRPTSGRATVFGIDTTVDPVDSLVELGVKKVVVGTAYSDPVNQVLHKFLTDSGFQVLALKGLQKTDASEINLITSDIPYNLAKEVYSQAPEADGIFISCGRLRGLDFIDRLEQEIGKPVTNSTQPAVRAALKLAGVWEPVEGYGRLLEMA